LRKFLSSKAIEEFETKEQISLLTVKNKSLEEELKAAQNIIFED